MTSTVTVTDGQVLRDTPTIDDPADRAVLDLYYDLPDARWVDVDEMHDRFVRTTGVPIVMTGGTLTRPVTDEEMRFGSQIAGSSPTLNAVVTEPGSHPDWRTQGVVVIPADALDLNTPQTPGMNRAAAITHDRVGSQKLWSGTVTIHPGARTGAHHHGELESVIYVLRGRARMRWGERLEYTDEAGPGGFIFVPPFVPHQEINALDDQPLECVVTRSGQDPIVINLDIEGGAQPELVQWTDLAHPAN